MAYEVWLQKCVPSNNLISEVCDLGIRTLQVLSAMVVLSISFGKKVNLGLSAKCSVAVLLLSSSLMSLSNIYFLL